MPKKKRIKWLTSVGQISEIRYSSFKSWSIFNHKQSHLGWLHFGRVLRTEPVLCRNANCIFLSIRCGIELVEDDNGIWNPESVNIKLFADLEE